MAVDSWAGWRLPLGGLAAALALAAPAGASADRMPPDRAALLAGPRGGEPVVAAQWRRRQAARVAQVPAAARGVVDWRGARRPYLLRQGQRIVEGDIAIGPPPRQPGRLGGDGLGLAGAVNLWPAVGGVAQIPYTVTQGNAALADAIARYNAEFAGVIQWVPRSGEADWVDVALDPDDHSGSGYSAIGRAGGKQTLGGSIDMDLATFLHEMGHATGLWHEHSRTDRVAHLTMSVEHAIGSQAPNLDVVPLIGGGQSLGLYDIASLMHYGPFTFTKDGEPTLESVPPGMPIGDLGDYSAGDLDAVLRLYGHAPASVTVTTNPPGLQVIVDGVARTAPYTFTPALDSAHSLGVPAGPQLLGERPFIYGRWNDNHAAAHGITIGRGNGLAGSPTDRPAVTVYQASFVELVRYDPVVWPGGSGTLGAQPAAQAYPPLPGVYYTRRQPVTLTADAQAGYRLYRLYTEEGGPSQNPKTTRRPDWVYAYFSNQAQTTVTTDPPGHWLWVDGSFSVGPVNFATDFDGSAWAAGTRHHIDIGVDPQQPYSWATRHPWQGWSDGGAAAHDIVVPAGDAAFAAAFGTEYNLWAWARQPCAGSVAATPASPDGFYPAGTQLSMSQSPVAGWTFTGWQRDLSGSQSPAPLAMDTERIVVADYNTSATPIAITSFDPPSRVAGQGKFRLLIGGQGFAADTRVFVNGQFRAPKSAMPAQIKEKMKPGDIAAPGTVALYADNLPPGSWSCSAYAIGELPVRSANAQPAAEAKPASLAFGKVAVGTLSAPRTVTLTNTGNKTLALHDTVVGGAQAADFVVSASTCGSALAAGAACTVDLQFQPQATGGRASTLWVIDAALDSPQAVGLAGTGK